LAGPNFHLENGDQLLIKNYQLFYTSFEKITEFSVGRALK